METNLIGVGDVLVTGITVTLRRINYQTCVSEILVFQTTVTTMANDATDLTMGTLNKLGVLKEYLLPYLQRR